MNNEIANPYKLQSQELKELCTKVSMEDFQALYARFPRRGLIDGVLSNLFQKFMEAVKDRIPAPQTSIDYPRNEQLLLILLKQQTHF